MSEIEDWVDVYVEKNERVYHIQPSCPECDAKQVQILDVDAQEWRCRNCHHWFITQVDV
jgi:ribosomal protein L37AE/L43A